MDTHGVTILFKLTVPNESCADKINTNLEVARSSNCRDGDAIMKNQEPGHHQSILQPLITQLTDDIG